MPRRKPGATPPTLDDDSFDLEADDEEGVDSRLDALENAVDALRRELRTTHLLMLVAAVLFAVWAWS